MNRDKMIMALLITCLLGVSPLAVAKVPLIADQVFVNAGNQWMNILDRDEGLYAVSGAVADTETDSDSSQWGSKGGKGGKGGPTPTGEGGA